MNDETYVEEIGSQLDRISVDGLVVKSVSDALHGQGFERELRFQDRVWLIDIHSESDQEPLSLNAIYDAGAAILTLPEDQREQAHAVVITRSIVPNYVETVSATLGVQVVRAESNNEDGFVSAIRALIDS